MKFFNKETDEMTVLGQLGKTVLAAGAAFIAGKFAEDMFEKVVTRKNA